MPQIHGLPINDNDKEDKPMNGLVLAMIAGTISIAFMFVVMYLVGEL